MTTITTTQTQEKKTDLAPLIQADAKTLKAILAPLTALSAECRLTVDNGQARFLTVDPAHVAMAEVKFPTAATGAKLYGVDVEMVAAALKPFGDKEVVTVAFLSTQFVTMTTSRVNRQAKLLDGEGLLDPKVPRLNLPGEVHSTKEELAAFLKHAKEVSDHVALWAKTDGKACAVAVGDNDRVDSGIGSSQTDGNDHWSMFSLDYLTGLVGAIPAKTDVVMKVGTDYPLMMSYKVADAEVMMLLAPRIEHVPERGQYEPVGYKGATPPA